MSIRSESMPYRGELSYQLQDLLRRNGMKAQLVVEQDQYKLLVQGHDSPLLEYPINEKQFKAPASGNVRLRITHNNVKWSGNHSEGFWMDIDDIAIMTPDDYAAYMASKSENGVEDIAVSGNAQVLGVYDLNGIRVADSVENLGAARGLYIIRTTEGAQKVIR